MPALIQSRSAPLASDTLKINIHAVFVCSDHGLRSCFQRIKATLSDCSLKGWRIHSLWNLSLPYLCQSACMNFTVMTCTPPGKQGKRRTDENRHSIVHSVCFLQYERSCINKVLLVRTEGLCCLVCKEGWVHIRWYKSRYGTPVAAKIKRRNMIFLRKEFLAR